MSNEDLPSISDIVEESNLPSYKDFIEVKEEEKLPSVEEYIEEKVVETLEEDIETVLSETAPEWSELVRLVNDVRKDIPEIPEIKYYDEQLKELSDKLSQIQDLNEDKLTEIESKIPELPEIKYYDADIQFIYDKIGRIKEEINSLPEVKYYESDLNSLKLRIEEVNQNIPTFPDWVQKVQEVPDFSWIGKTFSIIDDDFNKVQGHLDLIREKIEYQVSELNETIGKKEFELNIDIKNVDNSINDTNVYLNETKDKIYKELKDSSIRIWEHHKEFKDDDRKLKKSIISEQNKLKQSLQEQIKEIDRQSVKADEALLKFFNDLNEEVKSLPEVKYYDTEVSNIVEDIDSLRVNIEDIRNIVSLIKKDQKQLKENYLLNEPPEEKESVGSGVDPLTPMDQKFATLDDLSNHYRIFINRIQTQLSTMGGGGAGFIKDLDDVEFDQTTGDGKLLIYDQANSKWVGIASTALGGGDADSASKLILDVRNQNIGYGLTIGTPVYQVTYNSGQDRLDVEESRASNSITMPAKGVVSTDLANNTNGQIIVYGELEGVNTQAFDVGDELYVAPGGGLTNVRPTDPTHLVQKIAVVLKKSTANGAILVYGAGRTNDVPNNISIAGSITAVDGFFSGNVTVGGTITYEDVTNVDSLGIGTFRSGVVVNTGTATTALLVNGDARVTGILTVGTSSLSLDGINDVINVGTALTLGHTQGIQFHSQNLHASGFDVNNINASGIVTATSFRGDGSQLTSIISGVGIQSGSVRVGTGFTDINFTGAGVTIVGSGKTVTVNIPFSTITRQTETSSGVTTNFTITGGYEVGLIDVFLNGVKQRSGVDFTATNGSVVTMTPFISDGDVVEFQKIDQLTIGGITSVTNATNAFTLNSQAASYYLNYNNFSNTPTVPTNNNQLTNGAGFITTSFTNTNQLTNGAGFITATSSGTGLTGIVTSIVAGTNVTISGSTGAVTINSSGGGGSSGIEIENNGTSVGTGITAINFSTNVTVTASGGIATVTASGGGGGSSSFAIIDDVKSYSTGGGSFVSGAWQDRDLNTVTYDDDDIIDLNSSTGEVTLKAAGTYKIDFRAPGMRCDNHITRILDTSITLVRGRGSSAYSQDSSFYAQTDSMGSTIYTTTDVNQKFKLQHRCTTTQSSTIGMGNPHNVSAIGNNYYSQVIVTKLS